MKKLTFILAFLWVLRTMAQPPIYITVESDEDWQATLMGAAMMAINFDAISACVPVADTVFIPDDGVSNNPNWSSGFQAANNSFRAWASANNGIGNPEVVDLTTCSDNGWGDTVTVFTTQYGDCDGINPPSINIWVNAPDSGTRVIDGVGGGWIIPTSNPIFSVGATWYYNDWLGDFSTQHPTEGDCPQGWCMDIPTGGKPMILGPDQDPNPNPQALIDLWVCTSNQAPFGVIKWRYLVLKGWECPEFQMVLIGEPNCKGGQVVAQVVDGSGSVLQTITFQVTVAGGSLDFNGPATLNLSLAELEDLEEHPAEWMAEVPSSFCYDTIITFTEQVSCTEVKVTIEAIIGTPGYGTIQSMHTITVFLDEPLPNCEDDPCLEFTSEDLFFEFEGSLYGHNDTIYLDDCVPPVVDLDNFITPPGAFNRSIANNQESNDSTWVVRLHACFGEAGTDCFGDAFLRVWFRFSNCEDDLGGGNSAGVIVEDVVASSASTPTPQVWPNPANEAATIRVDTDTAGPVQVVISNLVGQIIWSAQVAGLTELDVSTWTPGVYFVQAPGQPVTRLVISR